MLQSVASQTNDKVRLYAVPTATARNMLRSRVRPFRLSVTSRCFVNTAKRHITQTTVARGSTTPVTDANDFDDILTGLSAKWAI